MILALVSLAVGLTCMTCIAFGLALRLRHWRDKAEEWKSIAHDERWYRNLMARRAMALEAKLREMELH